MKKFLVIQAARFGDLIQTKRLILSLKNFGEVYLLIDKNLVTLAKKIYPFATSFGLSFHQAPTEHEWQDDLNIFSFLRNISFSKIFNCNYSHLTTNICRLFDDQKIIGYRPAHCMTDDILKSAWARLGFRLVSKRYQSPLNLVDFWGWFYPESLPGDNINETARGRGGGLGVAISGREERRSLSANVLATIVNGIFNLFGFNKIKLFGTKKEQHKAQRLIHLLPSKMKEKIIDYTGKTTLLELNEEVENLDLLIAPDTGIMHLAAYNSIPILAFFLSSANCHETGPYGKGHLIFQSVTNCSPCLESEKCLNGKACSQPFTNSLFIKYLSKIYFSQRQDLPQINDLQCWTTDFDNLGQRLLLLGGTDKYLSNRMQLRNLIKNFLGIANEETTDYLPYLPEKKLIEWYFPEEEWMLPFKRYL